MTTPQSTLSFDAPQEMYTVPPARISHFISDDQLAVIESGGRDRFFDYHLASAGAALGFVQNAIALGIAIYTAKPPTNQDILLSMLFVVFVAAAICFRIASNSEYDPVKRVVKEVKARQVRPFHPDILQSPPPSGGAPITATAAQEEVGLRRFRPWPHDYGKKD